MNRLTKDNDTQYDLIGNYNSNIEEFTNNHKLRNSVLNKLGQLEDIEEELGVDLITLFKALKHGFFAKDVTMYHLTGELSENQKLDPKYLRLNMWYGCIEWENIWNPMDDLHEYYFKDYGKTWALTREELEVE